VAEIRTRLDSAFTMAAEKPYLVLPVRLAPFCDEECTNGRAAAVAQLQEQNRLPLADGVAQEQEELEALVEEAWQLRELAPTRRYGFIPEQRQWSRAFTSMFMHADWLHLLGNLYFLFLTAPFMEDFFGRGLFSLLYLGGGRRGGPGGDGGHLAATARRRRARPAGGPGARGRLRCEPCLGPLPAKRRGLPREEAGGQRLGDRPVPAAHDRPRQ
jgi:hypothetical protein